MSKNHGWHEKVASVLDQLVTQQYSPNSTTQFAETEMDFLRNNRFHIVPTISFTSEEANLLDVLDSSTPTVNGIQEIDPFKFGDMDSSLTPPLLMDTQV